jgi:hypothetical protein
MRWWRGSVLAGTALVIASVAAAASAGARVRREGQWPDADKPVSLEASGVPRAQALRKLADAAGWSLVLRGPSSEAVDVHVKGQPASKVLELLLSDGDYVARREGTLVSIEREDGAQGDSGPATDGSGAAAAPPPPLPPSPPQAPPVPSFGWKKHGDASPGGDAHGRAQDRTVMGGNVHIRKGETARDVTVFGGNVQVDGEVNGDVAVFGGNVEVHEGAHVSGDATVFGGRLALANGSRVDGDVSAIGGSLDRDPGAVVGGSVSGSGGNESDDGDSDDEDESHEGKGEQQHHAMPPGIAARALTHLTHSLRVAAVLYVIGTVLLALAGRRMTMLRVEMAARPMRSIALGLVGSIAFVLVLVALCVTVIGIPIAIVALLVAIFAVLGAMGAMLSVAGEALLRHKTENPYVHLAVGCALLVAVAWIPWVGDIVAFALLLGSIGVLVATRCAGLVPKKNGNGGSYRATEPG